VVTALSALTRLKVLHFGLEYLGQKFDQLHPDFPVESRRSPLPPRVILPSLAALKFKGSSEYLEELVARIDIPLLDHLDIIFTFYFFDLTIVLDTPQLLRFISRIPKFQAPENVRIAIDTKYRHFQIELWRSGQISNIVRLKITSMGPERLFACLARFCRLFPLPILECLYIDGGQYSVQHHQDNAENTRWLELFRPFTSVKNLFLSVKFAPRIASALQGLVGERAMGALPALENVFIEEFQPSGPVHEAIGKFVVERQLSDQPIVVSRWDRTAEQDFGDH
jgi:hypothetical protein